MLRDVGRVLQMPYGQVDKLTKLVPQNPANPVTLAQAIEGEPRCRAARDEEPVVARLLDIAQKLEGLYRHASTHAAGIVIGDRPLEELVPLYRDPKSDMPVTQFNMKWVEPAGLVKFDFLGLKTLTVLKTARRPPGLRGIADRPLGASRSTTRRPTRCSAAARRSAVFQVECAGHAQGARRNARRPLRGHHRARRALPAGPDGQHPGLLRAQARRRRSPTTSTRSSSRC